VLRRLPIRRTRPALVAVVVSLVGVASLAVGCGQTTTSDAVLAVYGDSYSAGGRQGGKGDAGWPALVADGLGADLRLHAAGGAGYVNGSKAKDETFLDQVRGAPEPDADVVVVFGSRNDKFLPVADVKSQAVAVLEAVRSQSPSAELVVVGPAWDDDIPPDELFMTRDAVASAAAGAGPLFVDPLAGGWLLDRPELIGTDGIHPTDAGHAYLAQLIEPIVREALVGEPVA
jgi:lysophospholipase L1-like esterase